MQTSQKPAELGIPSVLERGRWPFKIGFKQALIWVVLVGPFYIGDMSLIPVSYSSSANLPSIRLVLETPRRRYSAGEPIPLTVYLENFSQNETYYVGADLGNLFSIEPFHYIVLEIVDKRGRAVPIGRGAGTSIWKPGTTIAEKLAQEYIQLRPNMIVGIKNNSDLSLEAGQYKLRAIYHEVEVAAWSEAERKALPLPVLTQNLISNSVSIFVSP